MGGLIRFPRAAQCSAWRTKTGRTRPRMDGMNSSFSLINNNNNNNNSKLSNMIIPRMSRFLTKHASTHARMHAR